MASRMLLRLTQQLGLEFNEPVQRRKVGNLRRAHGAHQIRPCSSLRPASAWIIRVCPPHSGAGPAHGGKQGLPLRRVDLRAQPVRSFQSPGGWSAPSDLRFAVFGVFKMRLRKDADQIHLAFDPLSAATPGMRFA
jgi:hypothetical protein